MYSLSQTHPLRRWFAGLVEETFQQAIGVCDPPLLDYITELLTDFLHVERINLLADGSGRKVEDVTGLLVEIGGNDAVDAERRREVHRQIGDFTLFWTGVYPENLQRMRRRQNRDGLLDYLEQGKRAYAIASRLSSDDTRPAAGLLRALSDQFEDCVYGLGLVRQEWSRRPDGPNSLRICGE